MKPNKLLNVTGMFDDNLGVGLIKFHNHEILPDSLRRFHDLGICCSTAFTSGYERIAGRFDIFLNPEHPHFVVESREDMDEIFHSINEYNGEFDTKSRLIADVVAVVNEAVKNHFENTPIERYLSKEK